uniref:Uncharacterized protein n=1 Tax=Phaeomonas parva TaxID=124430 RepID=A0A6U4GWT6_9STRA|mmetsp:Transcript_32134/g.102221  ORF Transcript_32134/g.102221 Transcript_32134/m.102221 type:complete len:575 (+) Transcript_32134:379-2103(+)
MDLAHQDGASLQAARPVSFGTTKHYPHDLLSSRGPSLRSSSLSPEHLRKGKVGRNVSLPRLSKALVRPVLLESNSALDLLEGLQSVSVGPVSKKVRLKALRTSSLPSDPEGLLLRDSHVNDDDAKSLCSAASLVSIASAPCYRPKEYYVLQSLAEAKRRERCLRKRKKLRDANRVLVLKSIREKNTRRARADARRQFLAMQAEHLRNIVMMNYANVAFKKFAHARTTKRMQANMGEEATRIQRAYVLSRDRRLWKRYALFAARIDKDKWKLCLAIRTWRRQRAADRVTRFMLEFKGQRRAGLDKVAKNFVERVKRIQRCARHFLRCLRERMKILRVVWNDEEQLCLKRIQRELRRDRTMLLDNPPGDNADDEVRRLTRGLNRRVNTWRALDKKMGNLLHDQIAKGRIPDDEGSLLPKPLPVEVREDELRSLLAMYRKIHLQEESRLREKIDLLRRKEANRKYNPDDIRRMFNSHKQGEVMQLKSFDAGDAFARPIFNMLSMSAGFNAARPLRDELRRRYRRRHAEMYGDVVKNWRKYSQRELVTRAESLPARVDVDLGPVEVREAGVNLSRSIG